MMHKKNFRFGFQPIVLCIFLLLNFFLVASPFIEVSPLNIAVSGVPAQNRGADQEECFQLNDASNLLRGNRITLRNKRNNDLSGTLGAIEKMSAEPGINEGGSYVNSSFSRINPRYYHYLSLLYLY